MPDQALAAFEQSGALLKGHFVYTSGRHGTDYLEKFRILEDPVATSALSRMIASRFRAENVDRVAGPTTGGVVLAYEVASQLGVNALYAERGPQGGRILRRGFEVKPGQRVLIVDDIVTTGGSIEEMLECLRLAGAMIVGVGVLADRTGGSLKIPVPFYACLTVNFPSYEPSSCPLCAEGIPLEEARGSGTKVITSVS